MLKIKKILISQPEPESSKSPYFDIATKYGVDILFRPFTVVQGLNYTEFQKQKIEIKNYTSIVFTSKVGIDHFFRLTKELKIKLSENLRYFCLTEAFMFYLQKYIQYRKRKVFAPSTGRLTDLIAQLSKYSDEKFLFVLPEVSNAELKDQLKKTDINYKQAVMYRSVHNTFGKDEKFDFDMVVFFSPLGIQSLLSSFPKFEQGDIYFGCLGKTTAKALKDAGFRVDLEVPNPQFSSMTLALDDFIKQNQKNKK